MTEKNYPTMMLLLQFLLLLSMDGTSFLSSQCGIHVLRVSSFLLSPHSHPKSKSRKTTDTSIITTATMHWNRNMVNKNNDNDESMMTSCCDECHNHLDCCNDDDSDSSYGYGYYGQDLQTDNKYRVDNYDNKNNDQTLKKRIG